MFISDTDAKKTRRLLVTARRYLLTTAFCAVFGAVYEHFSFGVYSFFMLYAFAVPLFLGALPSLMLAARKTPPAFSPAAQRCWHAGAATLTVGCIFKGIIEIYGTDSDLTKYYWIAGGALLLAALLAQAAAKLGKS